MNYIMTDEEYDNFSDKLKKEHYSLAGILNYISNKKIEFTDFPWSLWRLIFTHDNKALKQGFSLLTYSNKWEELPLSVLFLFYNVKRYIGVIEKKTEIFKGIPQKLENELSVKIFKMKDDEFLDNEKKIRAIIKLYKD